MICLMPPDNYTTKDLGIVSISELLNIWTEATHSAYATMLIAGFVCLHAGVYVIHMDIWCEDVVTELCISASLEHILVCSSYQVCDTWLCSSGCYHCILYLYPARHQPAGQPKPAYPPTATCPFWKQVLAWYCAHTVGWRSGAESILVFTWNFHIDHIVTNCFGQRKILCSNSVKQKGEGNLVVLTGDQMDSAGLGLVWPGAGNTAHLS